MKKAIKLIKIRIETYKDYLVNNKDYNLIEEKEIKIRITELEELLFLLENKY